jgi:hypothetical protein
VWIKTGEIFVTGRLDDALGIEFTKRDVKPIQSIRDQLDDALGGNIKSIRSQLKKKAVRTEGKTLDHSSHEFRDVTCDAECCQARCGNSAQVMATLRHPAMELLCWTGRTNKAAACQRCAPNLQRARTVQRSHWKTAWPCGSTGVLDTERVFVYTFSHTPIY